MKGPFRRIRSDRRPADDPGQQHDPQATLIVPPPVVSPEQAAPTEVAPPPAALPAGVAPEDVAPNRPSFRDRARLRRRLRYLRRVRELGFRDLGGLAFDLHRFRRRNDELVLGKLAALDAVDRELRAIERVLGERRDIIELREPGVAACPRCGALHGSDAHFCPQCGTQFSGPRAIGEVGGGAVGPTDVPDVSPAQEPLPFSGAVQSSTPVSGALAGNPPPPAPPEPPAATETAHEGATPPADDPTATASPENAPTSEATNAGATANGEPPAPGDQPTQAFPALGQQDEPGSAVTSGDPLASRERSAE